MVFNQESTSQRNKLITFSYGLNYIHDAVSDIESTKHVHDNSSENAIEKVVMVVTPQYTTQKKNLTDTNHGEECNFSENAISNLCFCIGCSNIFNIYNYYISVLYFCFLTYVFFL